MHSSFHTVATNASMDLAAGSASSLENPQCPECIERAINRAGLRQSRGDQRRVVR